jgi:Transketolase, thiamine diphosphate binding domain
MAMAERMLAARFNQPGLDIVDHRTFAFCGEGDIMEGVCSEAASLAGRLHLGLGKLTVFFDSNHITLEGAADVEFAENVGERFEAYGWHVAEVSDANALGEIDQAIAAAVAEAARASRPWSRPSFVKDAEGHTDPERVEALKPRHQPAFALGQPGGDAIPLTARRLQLRAQPLGRCLRSSTYLLEPRLGGGERLPEVCLGGRERLPELRRDALHVPELRRRRRGVGRLLLHVRLHLRRVRFALRRSDAREGEGDQHGDRQPNASARKYS